MAFVPLTNVIPQLFDDNGNLLSGGKLKFFDAGTSTPTTVYSDNAGTALGTEVDLDADGHPSTAGGAKTLIWLETGQNYKIEAVDASNVTVWGPFDDIPPFATSGAARNAPDEWIEETSVTYNSGTSFIVTGDPEDEFGSRIWHVGRRVAVSGTLTGKVFARISSVSIGTDTTVTLVDITDSSSASATLSNESLTAWVGIASAKNSGLPKVWGDAFYFGSTGVQDGDNVTTSLQNAIDIYKRVILPPIDMYIDDTRLFMRDETALYFTPGATLRKVATSITDSQVIRIEGVTNVQLWMPRIIGDLDTHTGSTGEQGHGIMIRDANDVTVVRPHITKCWGDGIYIGETGGQGYSKNVTIHEPYIQDCRRQGISVVSVDGLWINGGYIEDIGVTSGTSPMFGIDFEPNDAADRLANIHVSGVKTSNCQGGGITYVPGQLDATSEPVDIYITGHVDNGSNTGFYAAGFPSSTAKTIDGRVIYERPMLRDNTQHGIRALRMYKNWPRVEIIEPFILRPNAAGSTSDKYGVAIWVGADTDGPGINVGAVRIIRPRIVDDRATPLMVRYATFRNFTTGSEDKCYNVDFIDPVELTGAAASNGTSHVLWYDSDGEISDRYRLLQRDVPTNETEHGAYFYSISHNESATGGRILTLIDHPNGYEMSFEVRAAQTFRIDPAATDSIVPLGNGAGKYVESITIGSRMTLRKINGDWYVMNLVGTWTAEP